MDEQLEALFADLFAERIASLDTTDSEQIVIEDLKRYLRYRNYDNDNINLLLFQFYQYYDINISYEEICNVANNNMYFYIRNYNHQEPVNQEPDNEGPDNEGPDNEGPVNEELVNEGPVNEGPVNEEPDNEGPVNEGPVNEELVNEGPVNEEPVNEEPMFNFIYRNILDNYQNLNNNLNNNNNNNLNNDNNNLNNDNNNLNNDNNNLNNDNNRIIYINNNFMNRINNFIRYNNYNYNNDNNQEYNDIPVPRLSPNLLLQAINIILPPQNQAMLEPVKVVLADECLEELKERVLEEKIEGMCMICFDEFNVDQTVLELPCNHLYHKDCIVPYFKEHSNKCPSCRCEVGKSKPLL